MSDQLNYDAEQKSLPRRSDLDLIRVVAIVLVISIHVSGVGFSNFQSSEWAAVNFYESFSRFAVPLFFMVTGALLVPRTNSIESIIRRVWKVTVPLFVWSLAYIIFFRVTNVRSASAPWEIFSNPVVYHFWFLYTLIGVYLFLPVMSGFYSANRTSTILFVLAILVIGKSLVPVVLEVTGVKPIGIDFTFMSWVAGYLVIGALISNRLDLSTIPTIAIVGTWIFSVIGIGATTWYLSENAGEAVKAFYRSFSPFVITGTLALYVLISRLAGRLFTPDSSRSRMLEKCSSLVFGIYLLHPFTLYSLEIIGIDLYLFNAWIAIPSITIATFLITLFVVFVMKKIPYVRSLLPS